MSVTAVVSIVHTQSKFGNKMFKYTRKSVVFASCRSRNTVLKLSVIYTEQSRTSNLIADEQAAS